MLNGILEDCPGKDISKSCVAHSSNIMIKCLTYSKVGYESDLCINEHYLTSSENKA